MHFNLLAVIWIDQSKFGLALERLDVGPDEVAEECGKLLGITISCKLEQHHRIQCATRYPLLACTVEFLGDGEFAERDDALQSESVSHRHQHLHDTTAFMAQPISASQSCFFLRMCPLHASAHCAPVRQRS